MYNTDSWLWLLTDSDTRQTHPLVREGALPWKRQYLSNSQQISGHEPQTVLDTKTDRLTDHQSKCDFDFASAQSHLLSQQVNAKSTSSSARGLPASHSATALKTYERLRASSGLPTKRALSAKKTYDHPACPPFKGRNLSVHPRFVASGPFQGQQLPTCARVTTAENSGVSTWVSRTFDIPQTFEKLCSGVDDPKDVPPFDHVDQDPFIDSEYTSKELNFAITNLKSPVEPGTLYFAICQMKL
jgi:hypothetical protein